MKRLLVLIACVAISACSVAPAEVVETVEQALTSRVAAFQPIADRATSGPVSWWDCTSGDCNLLQGPRYRALDDYTLSGGNLDFAFIGPNLLAVYSSDVQGFLGSNVCPGPPIDYPKLQDIQAVYAVYTVSTGGAAASTFYATIRDSRGRSSPLSFMATVPQNTRRDVSYTFATNPVTQAAWAGEDLGCPPLAGHGGPAVPFQFGWSVSTPPGASGKVESMKLFVNHRVNP